MTGFLKLPDIEGESAAVGHEDEIDILSIDWSAVQDASRTGGSARARSRVEVMPITVRKMYDASSPYIARACLKRLAFKEAIITFRRDSGDAPFDYLRFVLSKVLVSSYVLEGPSEDGRIVDSAQLTFDKIKIHYTKQADDHSAGDEHEIEYDVAAGV